MMENYEYFDPVWKIGNTVRLECDKMCFFRNSKNCKFKFKFKRKAQYFQKVGWFYSEKLDML